MACNRSQHLDLRIRRTSRRPDVLAEAVNWDATAILLHVEDQAHSQELLRSGDVLAAVTNSPAAVQGCTAEPLGVLRYVPAAAPV